MGNSKESGKKKVSMENLDKVVGGAGVNPDVLKALVGTSQRGIGINPDEQEMIARQNPKAIATGVIMKAVCGSIDKAAIKK